MGYVYLILSIDDEGKERHKIGISKNDPKLRLNQLKTGNSSEMRVLHVYESPNYKKIEKLLHARYPRTISNNEWFLLSDQEVLTFIDTCKKMDETAELLKSNPFF